jgi:hypothetical protein
MAPVEFDLTAACPAWEKFVGEIMCGDESLTRYIQRALGYTPGTCAAVRSTAPMVRKRNNRRRRAEVVIT